MKTLPLILSSLLALVAGVAMADGVPASGPASASDRPAPASSAAREPAAQEFAFKLYDTHAHFYSDNLARYPLHAEKAYMGPEKMKEIVLSQPSSRERVFALWDRLGVESGVGVQYSAAYESDNAYLLDVAAQDGTRVHPVVILSLADPAAPEALDRMVKDQGVVGIRMPIARDAEGGFPWLDSPLARRIWAVAEQRQLAVVLFPPLRGEQSRSTSDALAARVPAVARQYPHVRIVLDHMGWPEPQGAPDFGLTGPYPALALPNVRLKVTTVNFLALRNKGIDPARFLRHAVDVYGAGGIMWGSDQGNTPLPYEEMVRLAKASAALLTPEEGRQVFRDTGMRTFSRH